MAGVRQILEVFKWEHDRSRELSEQEAEMLYRNRDYILDEDSWVESLSSRNNSILLLNSHEYDRALELMYNAGEKENTMSDRKEGTLTRDSDGQFKLFTGEAVLRQRTGIWYDISSPSSNRLATGDDISVILENWKLEDKEHRDKEDREDLCEITRRYHPNSGECMPVYYSKKKERKFCIVIGESDPAYVQMFVEHDQGGYALHTTSTCRYAAKYDKSMAWTLQYNLSKKLNTCSIYIQEEK